MRASSVKRLHSSCGTPKALGPLKKRGRENTRGGERHHQHALAHLGIHRTMQGDRAWLSYGFLTRVEDRKRPPRLISVRHISQAPLP
jgi:hypothetical protein